MKNVTEMMIREGVDQVVAEWTATVPTVHRVDGCRADYHAGFEHRSREFAEGVLAGREDAQYKLCSRCVVQAAPEIEIVDDRDPKPEPEPQVQDLTTALRESVARAEEKRGPAKKAPAKRAAKKTAARKTAAAAK